MRIGGLIFFVLAIGGEVFGQEPVSDNTPKYSNEFIHIGVDARAFALGTSMVAHTRDVSSGYWNPAGLADLSSAHQLSLMHASYFAGVANYDYGSFATHLDDSSVWSVSVIRFSVDDIPDTRLLIDPNGAVNYDNIRFFSASDYGFLMSYGKKLSVWNGVRIGGSVKIIRRLVGDFAGSWGFGMNAGMKTSWKNWDIGIVGRDLFGTFNNWTINDESLADVYSKTGNMLYAKSLEISLPRMILGLARQFPVGDKFSILGTLDVTTTFDGKRNTLLKSEVVSLDPAVGMEVGFRELAFLRAGVNQFQQIKDFDSSLSWTFQPNVGVGFCIGELSIDYAFTDIGDQSAGLYSHIFSIKVNFDVEDK